MNASLLWIALLATSPAEPETLARIVTWKGRIPSPSVVQSRGAMGPLTSSHENLRLPHAIISVTSYSFIASKTS
jgi:hypothetical protein